MKKQEKWKITASWAAVGIVAALLFILSAITADSVRTVNKAFAGLATAFVNILFKKELVPSEGLVTAAGMILALCMYALLAFLIWNALRFTKLSKRSILFWSFAGSVLYAAADMLYLQFASDRHPTIGAFLIDVIGIVLMLLCIIVCQWLWVKCPRVFNRETISYVVFGVLTTLVNIISNGICFNTYNLPNALSVTIAWVVSVLFAYVVNKLFVFCSHNDTKRQALREFALFIGARVFSYVVDLIGMILLFDILHINNGVAKILMNVIVMIMNYFFSKLIIFKNSKPVEE